ncbi:hypothetical protein [Aliarcobacter cryaerophilus]|jgi:hypothetical protein|uniref:hypothetical protein n=1 Tax=Aliarcobacter cryaerophilus TaxID=28198 RepID=UPI003DA64A62
MSIVISVIDKNDSLFIASDKRAIKNGIINDNFKKIFEIKDNIYFGMTGIAEDGFIYLAHIKIHKKKVCSQFISICDKLFPILVEKLATLIVGINEGEKIMQVGDTNNILYSISSNANIPEYSEFFKQKLLNGFSIIDSIKSTIEYASQIDASISKEYEIIKI